MGILDRLVPQEQVRDEAIKYAAMIPSAEHGRIEVRPVMIFD